MLMACDGDMGLSRVLTLLSDSTVEVTLHFTSRPTRSWSFRILRLPGSLSHSAKQFRYFEFFRRFHAIGTRVVNGLSFINEDLRCLENVVRLPLHELTADTNHLLDRLSTASRK